MYRSAIRQTRPLAVLSRVLSPDSIPLPAVVQKLSTMVV
jgi:hypothetical protein